MRGVLAGLLGRHYLGVELRAEQVDANRGQHAAICPHANVSWICADSRAWLKTYDGPDFDFVFSCPPYADLERYSEEPDDLSTKAYPEFLEAYRDIIAGAIACLKMNRFAAFVVTELREKNKDGFYRGFVADTIQAFEQAGARFYNEAVVVNAIGSLPLRTQKQFNATRKLGRMHQYFLVFCKGDPREASKIVPLQERLLATNNQPDQGEHHEHEENRQQGKARARNNRNSHIEYTKTGLLHSWTNASDL